MSNKDSNDNEWVTYIQDYSMNDKGDALCAASENSVESLREYLLKWAKTKDKATEKYKNKDIDPNDTKTETYKIKEMKDSKIKKMRHDLNHRHHLHLSTDK